MCSTFAYCCRSDEQHVLPISGQRDGKANEKKAKCPNATIHIIQSMRREAKVLEAEANNEKDTD